MAKNPKAEFVASLERGLRVLQTFSGEYPQLTLSEVAALTGLTPATARRSLHTLEELGTSAGPDDGFAPAQGPRDRNRLPQRHQR